MLEILDHCDQLNSQFSHVDYKALKNDILKPVISKNVDPEVQVRGFLKMLRNTTHYQEAFKQVGNAKLQGQINSFIDGKSIKESLGSSSFKVSDNPSPGVKHHFSLLAALKKVVIGCFSTEREIEDDVKKLVKPEHIQNLPIVYEDGKGKIMVVNCHSYDLLVDKC
jgi:hypothetical protein